MNWARHRTLFLTVGGGVLVLTLSLGLAFAIVHHDPASQRPPPASVGGLVVQMGGGQDPSLDPSQPLRCFVGGQFIGLEPLGDCAQKNGVATNALEVGVDPNGAPAASGIADANVTPAPSDGVGADQSAAANQAVNLDLLAGRPQIGECLRYGGAGWRKIGGDVSLSACVQALFSGECVTPGGASYGRWMAQTLRLEPHRVEVSSDNVNFRFLAAQADAGCTIASF